MENFIEALKVRLCFKSNNSGKTLKPRQIAVYLRVEQCKDFQEKNTHKNLITPHTQGQTKASQAAVILFLPQFHHGP